jgi:hypothetical protein
MDIFRLAARRWIGTLQHAVEAIPIQRSRLNTIDEHLIIATPSPGHGDEALGWG